MSAPSIHFIEDGHRIHFVWDHDEVKMTVECPNEQRESLCNAKRVQCCVAMFLGVYGGAINAGRTDIRGPVEIAWTATAGQSDLDPEYSNIWIVPLNDPEYIASKFR